MPTKARATAGSAAEKPEAKGPVLHAPGAHIPGALTRALRPQPKATSGYGKMMPKGACEVGAPVPARPKRRKAPQVQRLPGHPGCDLRYQVPAGQAVEGAGFARAGVGIDITTGRPWAR